LKNKIRNIPIDIYVFETQLQVFDMHKIHAVLSISDARPLSITFMFYVFGRSCFDMWA